MSASKTVSITLLDKEYLISCADEERAELDAAADFINTKMQEMRRSNNAIGTERIAMITALNIASELLQQQKKNSMLDYTIERLNVKIADALGDTQQR